jgi:hypothetical protein
MLDFNLCILWDRCPGNGFMNYYKSRTLNLAPHRVLLVQPYSKYVVGYTPSYCRVTYN